MRFAQQASDVEFEIMFNFEQVYSSTGTYALCCVPGTLFTKVCRWQPGRSGLGGGERSMRAAPGRAAGARTAASLERVST